MNDHHNRLNGSYKKMEPKQYKTFKILRLLIFNENSKVGFSVKSGCLSNRALFHRFSLVFPCFPLHELPNFALHYY